MDAWPVRRKRVVVVGAGIGGLTGALLLAHHGFEVTVLERAGTPGGKMRQVAVGGAAVDSGPTVFTMRWVFDALLGTVGEVLDDHLKLARAAILARHHWRDGSVLDLHAETADSAEAIAAFAGRAEAERFLAFSARAGEVFRTLDAPFMRDPEPGPLSLMRGGGIGGLAALARIRAFSSLWSVMGGYFKDPRLRQLFGRYATYCGASPFQAPGPLMLIAHVEQRGVWLVEGGMQRLAAMLARLAEARGAAVRCGAEVSGIIVRDGRAAGVRLAGGEELAADAVLFNGDPAALFSGLLGVEAGAAVPAWKPEDRSLSAITWSLSTQAAGFPLDRHTVFFSDAYEAEFEAIFRRRRLADDPTIYVCAQDRGGTDPPAPGKAERLLVLVNAPAASDRRPLTGREIEACEKRTLERLEQAGLRLGNGLGSGARTTPAEFSALFPATGGALYGRSSHGWTAAFRRPTARSRVAGLYLAGGAVHPGPGVPMAALSGSHAAAAILADSGSTAMSRPAAMRGGMSTR